MDHEAQALMQRYFTLGREYTAKPLTPRIKLDYLDQVHQLTSFTPMTYGRRDQNTSTYATTSSSFSASYSSKLQDLVQSASTQYKSSTTSKPSDYSIN